MKNRYGKNLRTINQRIIDLIPSQILYLVTALELNKLYKRGDKILEIGCGEGHSARCVLIENSSVSLDLLDVSKEMITAAKNNLKAFSKRTNYIREDGLEFLKKAKAYNVIFSEWTIHNFSWKEKSELLQAIYDNLQPGGHFLLMDKVYPNKGGSELLEIQNKRYLHLKPKDAKDMIAHEIEDYSNGYRIDEKRLIAVLKKIGFKNISITDRVERDIVLVAQK